jgi:hypothetical protein
MLTGVWGEILGLLWGFLLLKYEPCHLWAALHFSTGGCPGTRSPHSGQDPHHSRVPTTLSIVVPK